MTLRYLRIFAEVFRQNNMSEAARQLHLTQPAVSMAIREMEDFYGVRLFDRLSRRLYPTGQGKTLYEYAVPLLSLFDEMETRMKTSGGPQVLRVGSSITIGSFFMPGFVKEFARRSPEVQVQVQVRNSAEIETALVGGELDFALIEGRVKNPSLHSEPFLPDRLCLLAPLDHPLCGRKDLTVEEVAAYPFVMREPGSAGWAILQEVMNLQGCTARIVWDSVSNRAVLQAVVAGVGLSLLPERLAQEALAQKKVCRLGLDLPAFSRNFLILYHRNKFLTPAMTAFLDMVRAWQE